MATWKQFHEYVLPNVQGCPVGIVDSCIRSACIEFCEKTLLWQQSSEPTDVVAGEARYGFSTPVGAKVVLVVQAYVTGTEQEVGMGTLSQTTVDELNKYRPDWTTHVSERPFAFFMDTDSSIRLIGIPAVTLPKHLTLLVALKPARSSTECPDFILEDWAEAIAHGALVRLHAMVGKPWSEKTLISYHQQKFRAAISAARSKSSKSRQRMSLIMLPRQIGNA